MNDEYPKQPEYLGDELNAGDLVMLWHTQDGSGGIPAWTDIEDDETKLMLRHDQSLCAVVLAQHGRTRRAFTQVLILDIQQVLWVHTMLLSRVE